MANKVSDTNANPYADDIKRRIGTNTKSVKPGQTLYASMAISLALTTGS
ncbi:MAG: hypothetical protein ACLTNP_06815 [Streptococcus salivarius]